MSMKYTWKGLSMRKVLMTIMATTVIGCAQDSCRQLKSSYDNEARLYKTAKKIHLYKQAKRHILRANLFAEKFIMNCKFDSYRAFKLGKKMQRNMQEIDDLIFVSNIKLP